MSSQFRPLKAMLKALSLTVHRRRARGPRVHKVKSALRTTLGGAALEAVALQLLGAVGEVPRLVLKELAALKHLRGVVVARVGHDGRGGEGAEEEGGETHVVVGE